MKILITGCAGFIGYHLCKILLEEKYETSKNAINQIVGVDNCNDLLYPAELKFKRLEILKRYPNFLFYYTDINNLESVNQIFNNHKFTKVVHLAAVPGVRYSLQNPRANITNNICGFYNILEKIKEYKIRHFIYASSSSVYGQSGFEKFSEKDNTDSPRSMYAATKKCNEIIAQAMSWTDNLTTTGLRFFTVYGPWGRPDMAYYLFAKNIMENKPITIYHSGDDDLFRDFTYIDDIVAGIIKVIKDNMDTPGVYNLGRGRPISLNFFISLIENELGKKAIREYKPMPLSDVTRTAADMHWFNSLFDYNPVVTIGDGIKRFISWFKEYYNY